jgi:hypothetical protein
MNGCRPIPPAIWPVASPGLTAFLAGPFWSRPSVREGPHPVLEHAEATKQEGSPMQAEPS